MTMSDEVESLAAELRQRTAERDALQARLDQRPDRRGLVAELRKIYNLSTGDAEKMLRAMLRKLDLESQ